MDIDTFLQWSISRQAQFTWKYGDHLARKDSFKYHYDLYKLDNFFVEIIYSLELGQVDKIEGFMHISRLYPYVEHIDLHQLYS